MTGLLNRRCFFEALRHRISEHNLGGEPLCLVLLDLDQLRSLNRTHGQLVGDVVLRTIAQIIRTAMRPHLDMAARYEDAKLAIVLPHAELDDALAVAERIRRATAACKLRRRRRTERDRQRRRGPTAARRRLGGAHQAGGHRAENGENFRSQLQLLPRRRAASHAGGIDVRLDGVTANSSYCGHHAPAWCKPWPTAAPSWVPSRRSVRPTVHSVAKGPRCLELATAIARLDKAKNQQPWRNARDVSC